jgi:hypothetical protein
VIFDKYGQPFDGEAAIRQEIITTINPASRNAPRSIGQSLTVET